MFFFRLLNYSRRGVKGALHLSFCCPSTLYINGNHNLLGYKAMGHMEQNSKIWKSGRKQGASYPNICTKSELMWWYPRFGFQICTPQHLKSSVDLLTADLKFLLEFTVNRSRILRGNMGNLPHSGTCPLTKKFSKEVRIHLSWLQDRSGYLALFTTSQAMF